MFELNLDSVDHNGIKVIKCNGRIDTETSKIFNNYIDKLIKDNKYKIVLEMGEITFMSSSGWGSIIGNVKLTREHGGDIKIANVSDYVKPSFEILELDNILDTFSTVNEALESFRAG